MSRAFYVALITPAILSAAAAGSICGASKLQPSAQYALASATPHRLWVYLSDKDLRTDRDRRVALAAIEATYDPHAIERRRLRRTRPGLFDETDLPIAARYRAAIQAGGARIHVEVPWLNAVSVTATPDQAARLAALPFVRSIEAVRVSASRGERSAPSVPAPVTDDFYGLSHDQLDQMNLLTVHTQGFTGQGIRVGILDTGFKRTHAAFNSPSHPLQVIAEYDFVNHDPNTAPEPGDDPGQHWHGTAVLGCIGAYQPDILVGGAFDAAFILCKTEDVTSETPVEEDNYAAGLQFIEAHGGDLSTASLVYSDWYTYSQLNGQTAVSTIAVNMATANGLFCLNAAGNSGHDNDPATGHLGGAPADAFQVITVGAVDGAGDIAGFSSDGPTADGRLKPEVLARGVATQTVDPDNDDGYAAPNGTSFATPLAACAVACLIQARPWWTVDEMRAFLFARASDEALVGHPDPLFIRGYGIINAAASMSLGCYANCDASTTSPALNVNDFICFQSRFAAGDPMANCDGSTIAPVLNVNDFICFQTRFAAGCP